MSVDTELDLSVFEEIVAEIDEEVPCDTPVICDRAAEWVLTLAPSCSHLSTILLQCGPCKSYGVGGAEINPETGTARTYCGRCRKPVSVLSVKPYERKCM